MNGKNYGDLNFDVTIWGLLAVVDGTADSDSNYEDQTRGVHVFKKLASKSYDVKCHR